MIILGNFLRFKNRIYRDILSSKLLPEALLIRILTSHLLTVGDLSVVMTKTSRVTSEVSNLSMRTSWGRYMLSIPMPLKLYISTPL